MVSLLLSCMTLSFTTSRRFIPTLSKPEACPTVLRGHDLLRTRGSHRAAPPPAAAGLNRGVTAKWSCSAEVRAPPRATCGRQGRGRDDGCPPPPAQIRASAPNAHGSYLREPPPIARGVHVKPGSTREVGFVWPAFSGSGPARVDPLPPSLWSTAFPPRSPSALPGLRSTASPVLCRCATP
jgi:hypothetical protein